MDFNIVEIAGLLLFLVGIFGLIASRNIIKSIVSLSIVDIGIITFFLGIRYEAGLLAPIGEDVARAEMADPVVQALMITAIVIGVAVSAVTLTMFSGLYHRYGSTHWDTVLRIRGEEQRK